MILLEVPFSEKDSAKSLGARWNPQEKKWYVPESLEDDLTPFEKWLPGTQPDNTTKLTAANEKEKGIPLSHLMHQVQSALRNSFAGAVWVVAEVANLNERRGHWYFELTENTDSGQQLANCRAMIWQNQADRILQTFSQQTGSELSAGQKVLLLVEVSFHEKFGFSLVIQDIDPSFTLGELEANLQAIRQQLIQEKLYDLNKQFPIPNDYFRVAIIAPPSAAGLGDFRADAKLLEQEGLCEFKYFYSAFQGERVVDEMLSAFDAFEALHQANQFDALIILRGGGAKLDLQPLNDYQLAKRIAKQNLPVLTGIGHERDKTILDEVAACRFDTPSKVIAGIRQSIFTAAQKARQDWLLIEKSSLLFVQNQKQQLIESNQQVVNQSQQILQAQKHALKPLMIQIEQRGMRTLEKHQNQISTQLQIIQHQALHTSNQQRQQLQYFWQVLEQRPSQLVESVRQQIQNQIAYILSAGPKTQLNRGFTLVKNEQNNPVISVNNAVTESSLQIHFKDGILEAKPIRIRNPSKEEK